jgi:hypothetical protein
VLGDPATPEQHLAHLEDICLIGCEEHDDLKRAIAGYANKSRWRAERRIAATGWRLD